MLASLPESFTLAYWRHRAEEARNIADQLTNDERRKTMLEVARHYDRMAEFSEKMERWEKPLR